MKKDPARKAIDENLNLKDLWQEIFQKTIDLSQSYYTYGIKTAEKQMTDDYGIHKAFTSLSEQLLSDPEKLSNSTTQFWEEQLNLWEKWINSDPTVVKKPDIVILFFQRLDLARDKGVQFSQICFDIFRYVKIHYFPLSLERRA